MAGISERNAGRISLALKPATAKKIRQLAYLADKSINDYVEAILEKTVERNDATLEKFLAAESAARQAIQREVE